MFVKMENGAYVNFNLIEQIYVQECEKSYQVICENKFLEYTWKSGFETEEDAQAWLNYEMENMKMNG